MDHDGGCPDDFMAASLLLTMPEVRVLGFVVTPADCFVEPAVRATRKILQLLGREELPVGQSDAQGLHPFPLPWRAMTYDFDARTGDIPLALPAPEELPGLELLKRLLREARAPVTLLVTGPLTNLATLLTQEAALSGKIAEVVWMGGALDVPGNVSPADEPEHDGSAEWNAYWDPLAVQTVWHSELPLVLCPLDVTDKVPVTQEFVENLRAQAQHPLSRIAAEGYELVMHLSAVSFWDVLAAAYLARPELFVAERVETRVITTGPSQGRIVRAEGGRVVLALLDVDVPAVTRYILQQWQGP
jgi:purine nucleosidase